MKYRKLRIAWSATCGIVCLLLIALWVRSYGCITNIQEKYWTRTFQGVSIAGEMRFWSYLLRDPMQLNAFSTGFQNIDRTDPQFKAWTADVPQTTFEMAFNKYNLNGEILVRFPHWFAAIVFAALAATPWLRWRFSLRTLLIAMTLVAVALGLVVFYANRPSTVPPLDSSDWNTR
jgi:hypothetical protein